MSERFPAKERTNTPANDQKSQPSKKLAPSLVSANFQSEVSVGCGLPPEVEVGLGRLVEPEVMEETMTPFPPVGTGVEDVGFCTSSVGLATQ